MYPIIRLIKDILIARRMAPLATFDSIHSSQHICWPWDLDMFMELNNGRTLTLYDLGRFMTAQRGGLIGLLVRKRWSMTMAGATIRYRRRVTMFQRITMRSRAVGWDDRFIYLEQSMWDKHGECSSHVLYRVAVLDKGKMIDPKHVARELGQDETSPRLADWILAWRDADALRPWPPMQE